MEDVAGIDVEPLHIGGPVLTGHDPDPRAVRVGPPVRHSAAASTRVWSKTTGRSIHTMWFSVMAKSCIIVGPGTSIGRLSSNSPSGVTRW